MVQDQDGSRRLIESTGPLLSGTGRLTLIGDGGNVSPGPGFRSRISGRRRSGLCIFPRETTVTNALPLAVAAGIYPLGLAIVLRYLGDPPSLRHAFAYLGGAAVVTLGAGAAIVVILRVAELPAGQERTLGDGMQTFLGVVLLLVALWIARHRATSSRRPARRSAAPPRGVDRPDAAPDLSPKLTVASGGAARTRAVFALGATTYLPSALYIAALKNLADAHLGLGLTILSLLVCASLVLLMVELPILLRLFAPRRTGRILAAYNAWTRRHGWDILLLVSAASGLYFLVSGIVGLLAPE